MRNELKKRRPQRGSTVGRSTPPRAKRAGDPAEVGGLRRHSTGGSNRSSPIGGYTVFNGGQGD